MSYLIKSNSWSFFCISILVVLFSCTNSRYDIYEVLPKGTLLNKSIIRESSMLFKTNQGIALMYDFTEEYSDEFNPHLLFFKDRKLLASSYFVSENIYDYRDDTIIAYLNENRLKRQNIYRNDVPKDLRIEYIKYDTDYPHGANTEEGFVSKIKYNKNETITLVLKDGSTYDNIPLWKITYDYKREKIFINSTYSAKIRKSKVFIVSKNILDNYFDNFI